MAYESATPLSEKEFSVLMSLLGPFEPKPHVAVAFSGGADSTALVLLANRWAKRRGGKVSAVTVDHGLRAQSAAESRVAQIRIKAFKVDGIILPWKDRKPTSGIQNAAREARYGLMSSWCRRKGILHLLLAHHQEDQAETLLHRLGRQTGADGLAGMAHIREMTNIRLLRPCLNVSRGRLQALLESKNVEWLEDPSNRNPLYARVRLRKLLPALSVEQISAAALGGTAQRLAQVRRSLDNQTALVLAQSAELTDLGFARISYAEICASDREIARRALERLLISVGGNMHSARYHSLNNLLNEIQRNPRFKPRTLAGCHVFGKNNNIWIVREAARCKIQKLTPGTWIDWDNRYRIKMTIEKILNHSDFVVRALGDDFPKKLRKKVKKCNIEYLNIAVRRALPSVWDSRGLVSIPHLGYARGVRNSAGILNIKVEFLPNRSVTNACFPVV